MGLHQSKEALLYQQVINGNIEEIKALHSEGASLEWFSKEGKTPLVVACMSLQLYDVAKTLIELGANVNAYCPGNHAGTALHHAAKKGLEQTVKLLLSNGANALAINDDCQTPLEVARIMGHTNVVRTIESHICFFSGWLRELYGPGFLEALVPQLLSRKIWVVVVQCGSHHPRKPLKLQLAMYTSLQDARPRTTITLWKAKVEEPQFNQSVPALNIFDKATRTRYKLLSSEEGEKQQLQLLYNACRGIPQVRQPTHTPEKAPPSSAEDVELAMAINASLVSATEERRPPIHDDIANGWGSSIDNSSSNGWGSTAGPAAPSEASSSGWLNEEPIVAYNGWGTPETSSSNPTTLPVDTHGWGNADKAAEVGWGSTQTGSTTSSSNPTTSPVDTHGWGNADKIAEVGWGNTQTGSSSTHEVPETASVPSAPPVPDYGPIHYPSIDVSPVDLTTLNVDEKGVSSSCVICLDAPVEGACIPCGHMAGCMSCLNGIKAKAWGCPVCRSKIDQVVRLYAV